MKRNRIIKNDEIKASAIDCNGKLISSLYDSGFTSIHEVISELSRRGSGCPKEIKEVRIHNVSRESYVIYNAKGKLIS